MVRLRDATRAAAVFGLLAAAGARAEKPPVPAGLDSYLPVPEDNPLTPEKVALGRKLFFDKRLSRDQTVSCATCHDPRVGFADRRPVAIGVGGQAGSRRTPRIVNRVYGKSFFWDGRAATLEEQVVQPIQNPKEMDLTLEEAGARTGVPAGEIARALASYVRTILSGGSRYDRYLDGDGEALNAQERLGLRLFRWKAGCSGCHVGPNLTDERFHNTGAGQSADPGRYSITGREEDRGAFKTPSLREAALTPPYMHDGSLKTLEEVIDFYDQGGKPNPGLDAEIRKLHLTAEEKSALAAFLRSLSGAVRDGL